MALAAGAWTAFTLLYAMLVAGTAGIPLASALIGQFLANGLLALMSVPVWWLTVRRMDRTGWGWTLATHAVIGPLYAWVGIEGYLGLFLLITGLSNVPAQMLQNYNWILATNLLVYVVQFGLYHAARDRQISRLREQQAAALEALAQEQELAALKAQINPHFLFNTLNSISATIARDPEAARALIADLSELLRYALDASERDLVALSDEVRFARAYLALEERRFSDRLRVHVEVDDDALHAPVPAMTLQPLVENALEHGIAPSEDGGAVTLSVRRDDGHACVTVADTGVGPSEPVSLDGEAGGMGLANTNTRLQALLGSEAMLKTEPNEPRGFRVTFTLPLRQKPDHSKPTETNTNS